MSSEPTNNTMTCPECEIEVQALEMAGAIEVYCPEHGWQWLDDEVA